LQHRSAKGFEVAFEHTDCILRPELLELIAGSSYITGQMVNGADCLLIPVKKMRASLTSRLEGDCFTVLWINGSVGPD
jgi:hypothetical protein